MVRIQGFRLLERHEEETLTDEIDCEGIKFFARDGEFVSTSRHAMFFLMQGY